MIEGKTPTKVLRQKGRIPALTGIRAIAAFMVFFHHFPLEFLKIPGFDLQRELHVGVSLFFVLSGFLITYRYEDSYSLKKSWLKRYFLNRFARIYPVYFILLIPTLFFYANTSPLSWLANITLLKGFFEGQMMSGIAQAWSLTVEETFYASAPLIFFMYDRSKSLKYAYAFFLVLLPLCIFLGQVVDFNGLFGSSRHVLLYTFFGRFTEFFIGIYLAKLLQTPYIKLGRGYQTIIGSLGIFLCISALAIVWEPGMKYVLHSPVGIATNNLILPVFVAILFLGLIQEKTWLSRILSTSLFDILGKASYVFYLIHFGFISYFLKNLGVHNRIMLFVLINLIAILIYKFVEHPLNKWIRSL